MKNTETSQQEVEQAQADPQARQAFLLLEGIVSNVVASCETEDFYEQIAAGSRMCRLLAGVDTIVGDRYRQSAEAASAAVYAGEDRECFFCLVDDQVVCGAFGGASKLPIGKAVKAVVERRGELLIAQAILSESDGLLWTLWTQGHKAYWLATWRFGWWGAVSPLAIIGTMALFTDGLDADHFWSFIQASVIWALFIFGFTWKDAGPMKPPSDSAADVFRMLGFARPENVSLNGYQYSIVHSDLVRSTDSACNHACIYSIGKAVDDGKLTFRDHRTFPNRPENGTAEENAAVSTRVKKTRKNKAKSL